MERIAETRNKAARAFEAIYKNYNNREALMKAVKKLKLTTYPQRTSTENLRKLLLDYTSVRALRSVVFNLPSIPEEMFPELPEKEAEGIIRLFDIMTAIQANSAPDFIQTRSNLQRVKNIVIPSDLMISLDNKLPERYPYFVRSVAHIQRISRFHGESMQPPTPWAERVKEPFYVKITSKKDRDYYMESFWTRLFPYQLGTDSDDYLHHVDTDIIFNLNKQKLIKVAQYIVGNCLLNIINGMVPKDTLPKIYKKLPHLKPTEEIPNPLICEDDIRTIARTGRIKFNIYSKLGALSGMTWEEIGDAKRKTFHVVFGNEHANIMPYKMDIKEVKYVDVLGDPERSGYTDVVDIGFINVYNEFDAPPAISYYVRIIEGECYMYKSFRPSSVTKNADDDENRDFYYSVNSDQVISRIFKRTFNIFTIKNTFIRNVVKKSEHFIGRKVFGDLEGAKEIDMNKCYVSYRKNPYYIGFPANNLYPCDEESKSLFYVCSINNPPKAFKILMKYESGTIVITKPVKLWLCKNGATIDTLYTLAGDKKDINLISFLDAYKPIIGEERMKSARNSLIGRCISGGLRESKKLVCRYVDDKERDQLIYEADKLGYPFSIDYDIKTVTVLHKTSPNGAFQFHSYVLGYALISMAEMMQQMINNGNEILGYNVDAILYRGMDPTHGSDEFGGWKISDNIKNYYHQLSVAEPEYLHYEYDIECPVRFRDKPENTVIIGPPGTSKSYPFLNTPYFDQIILTPTRELRDDHIRTQAKMETQCEIVTMEKYFQTNMNKHKWLGLRKFKKIPGRHSIVVIDEMNMFDERQWSTILKRAALDCSVVIALGDSEQICNSITGKPIELEFFKKRGFLMIETKRTIDGKARQSYEDGCILDSLRGLKVKEQLELISKHVKTIDIQKIDINNSIHITDNHECRRKVNLLAKRWWPKDKDFPCKDKDNTLVDVDTNSKEIWWGRRSMKDIMPEECIYEPMYSVTADSIQGKTLSETLYIDCDISRVGAFYTAITRCKSLSQVYIVTYPPKFYE